MADSLSEKIKAYVQRVQERYKDVRNEQATKQSLIGPFFTMLGYDLTDPRVCLPEYKVEFRKDQRSTKPIDWAFQRNDSLAFFVEAKAVSCRLDDHDEQLGDYFGKTVSVKLGVLTNGLQWRFFTDLENENKMDTEPFATWDISQDETPPLELFDLLQESRFNAEHIREYAEGQRDKRLERAELERLLEPANEFTKMAISKLVKGNVTPTVLEKWKPRVTNALNEWAAKIVTDRIKASVVPPVEARSDVARIETTPEEIEAFEATKRILGSDAAIAYTDSSSYFKIHLAEKRTWVFLRLQARTRQTVVWVPLPKTQVVPLVGGRSINWGAGWSGVVLEPGVALSEISELIRTAYSHVKETRGSDVQGEE